MWFPSIYSMRSFFRGTLRCHHGRGKLENPPKKGGLDPATVLMTPEAIDGRFILLISYIMLHPIKISPLTIESHWKLVLWQFRWHFSLHGIVQENWTWVKGAFHTVDRPYGHLAMSMPSMWCRLCHFSCLLMSCFVEFFMQRCCSHLSLPLRKRNDKGLPENGPAKCQCSLHSRPSFGLRPPQALETILCVLWKDWKDQWLKTHEDTIVLTHHTQLILASLFSSNMDCSDPDVKASS